MAKLSDLIDHSMTECTPSFRIGVFIASLDILERDIRIYSPELYQQILEHFKHLSDHVKYRLDNYVER